ncbi:PEP/pyruvate-binding domain-containing protein [Haloarcula onubensis]|uniref:PEP-utilizing enzyme n=1 Tax=Haloarcula onubensis TaxID=2950539 RepID=A0ABU2FPI3_9EURY|nr:PEP/pyruvate-binding domain-containing protein [Halomicroarcula sp. S3CR25-11]MDS0282654.1 PEP-utilizing enzyme [Halomicroarcula sp. S3CR25-11]
MPPLLLALDAPLATEPSLTGGKGATLARLRQRGFPVPDGAVVTTELFDRVTDDPAIERLRDRLERADEDDTPARRAIAADLRRAIRDRSVPADLRDALTATLPDGPYAVRSSGTSEDSPDASFAGQYETTLGVAGGDLAGAILACLASLFSDRAVAYRARNDLATAALSMAVVVQRVVDADVSGICFSADPLTGTRSVSVIDAGRGLGEAQVSGTATADTLRVDRTDGSVLAYHVGADRTDPVLTDRDATALVRIAARIEDTLGRPQDVEWAIADGEIAVLQARPITALYPVPEREPPGGDVRVYYSFGHRQGMPEAMPPLVLDIWETEVEFVREHFGLAERFGATAGGRLYIDLTAYLTSPWVRDRLVRNLDIVDRPAANALRTLSEDHPEAIASPAGPGSGGLGPLRTLRSTWPLLRAMVGSIPGSMLDSTPAATLDGIRRQYTDAGDAAIERIDAAEAPAERFTTAGRELESAIDWLLDPFYGPLLSAMLAGAALRRLVPEEADSVDALALGIEGDVVYRMTRQLGELADVARESPAVATALTDGDTPSRADLAALDGSEAFLDAFDGFLSTYGFRAIGEIDVSRPRYREDPTPLLTVVASTLETRAGTTQNDIDVALRARAGAAETRLIRAAPAPVAPLVRRLIRTHRGYLGIRELPKFALARLLAELREAALAAGDELTGRGALPDAGDVWLLTVAEVTQGLSDPRTLSGIDIAGRRREFERDRRLTPPRIITSTGYVPPQRDSEPAADRRLHGTGAAPGVVEGTATVVTDPRTQRVGRGDVLVAAYTDPGWTPLFVNAAVVTEVGGRLTHGSLVAREYGIPAVVAVDGATEALAEGSRVRVDGTNGVVEILE